MTWQIWLSKKLTWSSEYGGNQKIRSGMCLHNFLNTQRFSLWHEKENGGSASAKTQRKENAQKIEPVVKLTVWPSSMLRGPEGSETIRCHGVSNGKSPAILGYGSQTSKRKHRRKKTLIACHPWIQPFSDVSCEVYISRGWYNVSRYRGDSLIFFLKKIFIYIVWTFWTRFVKACDARFSPDVSLGGFWEGTCTYLYS